MPTIIERRPVFEDTLADYLSVEQVNRLNKSIDDYEDRKRKQRTTAQVVGAIAGAAGGMFLAPAAIASSAATGAGLTAAGTSAAAGSLAAGLTGASIGSQIGGQIAGEDYAGALGTAATAVEKIMGDKEDMRLFGYKPSPQEKLLYAKAAIDAGTNIGVLTQQARSQGVTIPQALQQIGKTAGIGAYQKSYETKLGALDAELQSLVEQNPDLYEVVPNDGEVGRIQQERDGLSADASAYYRSGGNDGATQSEVDTKVDSLRERLGAARRGSIRRKEPVYKSFGIPGIPEGTEIPPGYHQFGNKVWFVRPDGKGEMEVTTSDLPPSVPWDKVPPGPEREQAKRLDLEANKTTDEAGNLWVHTPQGWQIEKNADNKAERMAKLKEKFATYEDGTPRPEKELTSLLRTIENADRVVQEENSLIQDVVNFAGSMQNQSVPMEVATAIAAKVQGTFGDDPPSDVRGAVNAILAKSAMDEAANAITSQSPSPPLPAPRGSASAAEEAGRMTARGVKSAPILAGKASKAIAGTAVKTGKGFGEFIVGAGEEMFGFGQATPEERQFTRFAQIQKQNLEAGIDDPVIVIRPDGQSIQVIKGSLTPERLAEFRAARFIMPGLD